MKLTIKAQKEHFLNKRFPWTNEVTHKYKAKRVKYCFRCDEPITCNQCGYPLTTISTCVHGGIPTNCPKCQKKDKVKSFASKAEYKRFRELRLLEAYGDITQLTLQPKYEIIWNDIFICEYRADFSYIEKNGAKIVEDVKGFHTYEYEIKKALMKAAFGIEIRET